MLDFASIFANAKKQSKKLLKDQTARIEKEVKKKLNSLKTKKSYSDPTPEEVRDRVKTELLNRETVDYVARTIQCNIGQRLKKIREKNCLTLEDITAELEPLWNLDNSTISRWEKGKRAVSFTYLIWFAQRFDVDLHWLLTGEKPEPKIQELEEARKMIDTASKILGKY